MSVSPKTECHISKILVQLLESKHYHLAPDVNEVRSILYHFCNLEDRLTFNISNLLFQFIKCSWSWSIDFIFGPAPHKSHAGRTGLCGGHSFSPRRPIHWPGKWLSTVIVNTVGCPKLYATFYDSCTIWKPTHYRSMTNVFTLVTL